jgi:hypothetical protein
VTSPKTVVRRWIAAFNAADPDALAAVYREDAVNHQVAAEPVTGRDAIRAAFAATAATECLPENLFEDGEWAILEWRTPEGIHACSLFHIIDRQIALQRDFSAG